MYEFGHPVAYITVEESERLRKRDELARLRERRRLVYGEIAQRKMLYHDLTVQIRALDAALGNEGGC